MNLDQEAMVFAVVIIPILFAVLYVAVSYLERVTRKLRRK